METVAKPDEESGAHITKDSEIMKINETPDGHIASVVYRDADGAEQTLVGDEFISSMPAKDLVDSMGDGNQSAQPVPARMKQIVDGFPYRDFVTAGFLVDHLTLKSETNIQDAHQERVKKAYLAYFDTWSQIDDVVQWLDSFGNLYCVERNGQHRYNNMNYFMVVTAFEAVDNIKNGRADKKNVWNVNTEKEYHEER